MDLTAMPSRCTAMRFFFERFMLPILVGGGTLFLPGMSLADENLARLTEDALPAIVSLTIKDASNNVTGQGSGFFVDGSGGLITNYHVVQGAAKIEAHSSEGIKYFCNGVLTVDEERDLAFLQFAAKNLPFLKVGSGKDTKVGSSLVVIGNPKGLSHSVTSGILSAHRPTSDGDLLQITAPISPGSSGSPVIDSNGIVRGVATFYHKEGQSLNFAVDGIHVAKLVDARETFVPVAVADALAGSDTATATTPVVEGVSAPGSGVAIRIKGTPREIGETVEESLSAFMNAHLKTMRGNNATRWAGMFTATPYYCYAKGETNSARLVQDRRNLIKKYPRRIYELDGQPKYATSDGSQASATFKYSYRYSGSKTASGSCREDIKLVWVGDRWLITRYDETISRD